MSHLDKEDREQLMADNKAEISRPITEKWIIGVLVLTIVGLISLGTNDYLSRTRNNEVNIVLITDRLAKVEANQQRVLEQLTVNGTKLDRLIERQSEGKR